MSVADTEPIVEGDGPIVVTGGAGFVGANLVAEVQRRDPSRRVIVIDDLRSSSFANLVEACERVCGGGFTGSFIAAGVHELKVSTLFKRHRPAGVFHLGAITDTTVDDEVEMIRVNVGGFRELMRECDRAGVPLVYASSAATYGSPEAAAERRGFRVEEAGKPNNVYGFSKWLMENEHRRFTAEATGVPEEGWERSRVAGSAIDGGAPRVVGLRYFNVFGPGEGRKGKMASIAHQMGLKMLGGENPRIFTGGEQARDQVSVDDVVDCTLAAAGEGVRPGVYNLGSGVATTFNELVDAVRRGLGFGEDERPTEYFEMPAHIAAFYQSFTLADMTETERGVGWSPEREPQAALEAYGRWMRERHESASLAMEAM